GDQAVATAVALLHVPTQLRRAAACQVPQDPPLVRRDDVSILLNERWCELPDDLGHFKPRSNHGVGSPFGGDEETSAALGAWPAAGTGLKLSPGSSNKSSGLVVAVTFAIDT